MTLKKLDAHPNGPGYGLLKDAVGTAEYAAASYAFGFVQNAYPGRARIANVPLDLAVGVAAKVLSLASTLTGHGKAARSHLDAVGNAGIGAWAHTLGAGAGFQKSGRVRAFLPATSVAKLRQAVPESTIFGELGKAPKGDLLSADDLARLASR